jgi:hypothetical protein
MSGRENVTSGATASRDVDGFGLRLSGVLTVRMSGRGRFETMTSSTSGDRLAGDQGAPMPPHSWPSFTPGPWSVDAEYRGVTIVAGEKQVARVTKRPRQRAFEQEANARLIAAAPKMLRALKAAKETWPDDYHYKLICEAISEAEGK